MDNLKNMATRAGNTIYFAAETVATVGKEKGFQALQAVQSSNAYQSATVAAAVGKEKVVNTQAYQVASSAAAVGKEKAVVAASAAASAAADGKTKASAALEAAKTKFAKKP